MNFDDVLAIVQKVGDANCYVNFDFTDDEILTLLQHHNYGRRVKLKHNTARHMKLCLQVFSMQDLEMTFTASHLDSLDDRQLGELLECCGVFNYTDDVLDLYRRYPQFVEYLPKNLYNILSHHDSFCSLKFNRNAPDVSQLSADKIVHLMKINKLSKYNEVVTKKDYIKYCHTGPIILNNSDADETDQLIEFALDNDKLDVFQNHTYLLSEQQ